MDDDKQSEPRESVVDADTLIEANGERIAAVVLSLTEGSKTQACRAARALGELAEREPKLLSSHVRPLVAALGSSHVCVRKALGVMLPQLARVAPAKVAKRFDALTEAFDAGDALLQGTVVDTLVVLCQASVAHQRRTGPFLTRALEGAEPKTVIRWAVAILPILKGEPYATARAVVEARLPELSKAQASKLVALFAGK